MSDIIIILAISNALQWLIIIGLMLRTKQLEQGSNAFGQTRDEIYQQYKSQEVKS